MGRPLHNLIDSGSTHNFLDIDMARKLGCTLEPIATQAVIVPDVNRLPCQYMC